jgi:hypothetical protein
MTGGVMVGESIGEEAFRPNKPPLVLLVTGSMIWKVSLGLLKNMSRITAAPSSNTSSSPL